MGGKRNLQNTHVVNVKRNTSNSNSLQRVKKCRYNKSEEQRSHDKLKDRERKRKARGTQSEERKITENALNAERMMIVDQM